MWTIMNYPQRSGQRHACAIMKNDKNTFPWRLPVHGLSGTSIQTKCPRSRARTMIAKSETPRAQPGASKTTSIASAFSLLSYGIQCNFELCLLSLGRLMSVQSIQLAKSAHPITLVSLRDVLERLHSLWYFSTFLLHWISTFGVEMIRTNAHDLWRPPAYLSQFHDSRLSRRIILLLSCGHLLARAISDTLVPIPNDISFRILYDWFALVPFHQYTNSLSSGEFISDHRSEHSSLFQ